MLFEIGFNWETSTEKDRFIEDELGATWVKTDATKYGPFEILMVEIEDFDKLKDMLDKVDKKYDDIYSAVVSFDPPTIFFDEKC